MAHQLRWARTIRASRPGLFWRNRTGPGEVNGRDYWFVSPETFEQMVQRKEFAEHAFVHGNPTTDAEPVVTLVG